MTLQVSIDEAQARWSEVIDTVLTGGEVVITIAEHPVVRLESYEEDSTSE